MFSLRTVSSIVRFSLAGALAVLGVARGVAGAEATPVFNLKATLTPSISGWTSVIDDGDDDGPDLKRVPLFGCTTTVVSVWEIEDCGGETRILTCEKTECVRPSFSLDPSDSGFETEVTFSDDCFYCIEHPECCDISLPLADLSGGFGERETSSCSLVPESGGATINIAHRAGADAGRISNGLAYFLERSVELVFEPTNSSSTADSAVFEMPVALDGILVDGPDENGFSRWSLIVESPQIGVIFSSKVEASDEGVVIEGDVPPDAFDISNGFLMLSDYEPQIVTVPVPAGTEKVELVVRYEAEKSSDGATDEETPSFTRSDANADETVDIADGFEILRHLFRGNDIACRDAGDTNDSGRLDLADAMLLFQFLFRDGSAPPAPGPFGCGVDPTKDDLDCASPPACDS